MVQLSKIEEVRVYTGRLLRRCALFSSHTIAAASAVYPECLIFEQDAFILLADPIIRFKHYDMGTTGCIGTDTTIGACIFDNVAKGEDE